MKLFTSIKCIILFLVPGSRGQNEELVLNSPTLRPVQLLDAKIQERCLATCCPSDSAGNGYGVFSGVAENQVEDNYIVEIEYTTSGVVTTYSFDKGDTCGHTDPIAVNVEPGRLSWTEVQQFDTGDRCVERGTVTLVFRAENQWDYTWVSLEPPIFTETGLVRLTCGVCPTSAPSTLPSISPSNIPSSPPSTVPSFRPSDDPSSRPSASPRPSVSPLECESGSGIYLGAAWGDPHITTIGGQEYECQVQGEVVLARLSGAALSSRLRIHGMFVKVGEWSAIMTGVAFESLPSPKIQLSTKNMDASTPESAIINGCEVTLRVDTVAITIEEGIRLDDGFVRIELGPANSMAVTFDARGLEVLLVFQQFAGICFISGYFKMTVCGEENLIGAFGSKEGAPWVQAPDGAIVSIPDGADEDIYIFREAYDHCTQNWCLHTEDEAESIILYEEGNSFAAFAEGCDIEYSNPFDPSQSRRTLTDLVGSDILAICGDLIPCQTDGLVLGVGGAQAYFDDQALIQELRATLPSQEPTTEPTQVPSENPTTTPTENPTTTPTKIPTTTPTKIPTKMPMLAPGRDCSQILNWLPCFLDWVGHIWSSFWN